MLFLLTAVERSTNLIMEAINSNDTMIHAGVPSPVTVATGPASSTPTPPAALPTLASINRRPKPTVIPKPALRKPNICLSSSKTKVLDRSKATMKDLLSYNPPLTQEDKNQEPLDDVESEKSAQKIPQRRSSTASSSSDIYSTSLASPAKSTSSSIASHTICMKMAPPQSPSTPSKSSQQLNTSTQSTPAKSTPSKSSPSKGGKKGPRVKVGPDGNLIVDEESLIVERKDLLNEDDMEVVHETNANRSGSTYQSFRSKKISNKRWSDLDTLKFFKALQTVGTDFTLMSSLIFKGSRSRLDLRNKFKKEERENQRLVDSALSTSNITLLDELIKTGEIDDESLHDEDENQINATQSSHNDNHDEDVIQDHSKTTTTVEVIVPSEDGLDDEDDEETSGTVVGTVTTVGKKKTPPVNLRRSPRKKRRSVSVV